MEDEIKMIETDNLDNKVVYDRNYAVISLENYNYYILKINELNKKLAEMNCYYNVLLNIRKDVIKDNDYNYKKLSYSELSSFEEKLDDYNYKKLLLEFMNKGFNINEAIKQLELSLIEYKECKEEQSNDK